MSNFRCLYFCTTQIRRPILPSGFQYIPHPSINRSSLKKGRLAEWKGGPWKFTLNELITAPIWHCMPATENEALIAPSRHYLTLPLELTWNKKALFASFIPYTLIWISLYYRNQSYLPTSIICRRRWLHYTVFLAVSWPQIWGPGAKLIATYAWDFQLVAKQTCTSTRKPINLLTLRWG